MPQGSRVRTIGWEGRATVTIGDTVLNLTIDTRVEPFTGARSRSWITDKGPGTARTLIITHDAGWVERDGARTTLPDALVAHERQQYGIYGYLLRALRTTGKRATLTLREPGYPSATFHFDGSWPASADYRVVSPDAGKPPIDQHFTFADPLRADGLAWPRRMTITQGGKPYFTLDVERFRVERG